MFYIKPQNKEAFFEFEINYIKVNPTSGCYILSTEEDAQGIVVKGIPYSTNIKNPISGIEIATYTKEENWDESIKEIYNNILCEKAKENLIPKLSEQCNMTINKGMKIQLSNGEEKEFSYDINDQANISEMFNAILMGATQYPYHANGESCEMYDAKDIVIIYSTLSSMKTAQITYHNQLKQYVLSLSNLEDIYNTTYGQELTGEYLSNYNNLITQAKEQLNIILEKIPN